MDWFKRITGFAEQGGYGAVQATLLAQVRGEQLLNQTTGRAYAMGRLEVVSLAELRKRVRRLPRVADRPVQVGVTRGDVRAKHLLPEHAGALFQVASQFNLLEMVGPSRTPEHGVSAYAQDATQGPACAMAAGAGTIYRNYLVDLPGGRGQTALRQIDTLADLGRALGHDPVHTPLWDWRNGYALCSAAGLAHIDARLAACDAAGLDELRGLLRIGLHWDVEVCDAPVSPGPTVSQAFCSALPVAYGEPPAAAWEGCARLVLEASYEATLLAGVLNLRRGASAQVLLTRVGGGVFGNQAAWIDDAIERGLRQVDGEGLQVLHVQR
ncbi:MAG: hypothetical protein RIQ60_1927 [Pseudomonadota bacterium]|jgi:hypothetical protein